VATSIRRPASGDTGPTTRVVTGERRIQPIKWFAGFGAAIVVLQLYIYGRWVASGNISPTPRGPSEVPGWMVPTTRIIEWTFVAICAGLVSTLVIRPRIRQGRFTSEALLVLSCACLIWQDMLPSYFRWSFITYNSVYYQWGSWANFIPGWQSPRADQFAEPLLIHGAIFLGIVGTVVVLGSWVMREAKKRRPHLGGFGQLMVYFWIWVAVDFVMEPVMIRVGMYQWVGVIPELTLWAGSRHQFPLYQPFLYATMLSAMTALFHFRNDYGENVIERGARTLKGTATRRTGIRFLAYVGAMNLVFFGFNFTHMFISLVNDSRWPAGIVERSYLTSNLCGPGTDYACPGPEIPNPRGGSWHVAPDGTLVKPR